MRKTTGMKPYRKDEKCTDCGCWPGSVYKVVVHEIADVVRQDYNSECKTRDIRYILEQFGFLEG